MRVVLVSVRSISLESMRRKLSSMLADRCRRSRSTSRMSASTRSLSMPSASESWMESTSVVPEMRRW